MAALEHPDTEILVIVTGTQMGKTEFIFAALGHNFTDGRQVDSIYVGPTEKQVRSISKHRIAQMINSTPALKEKHIRGRFDSVAEKFFAGSRLGFAHAGSSTELSSHPSGLICIDELTRMESDVQGEGSPVMLAIARADNYPDARVIITSTPGVEGVCPTWAWFLQGTMEIWRWTCAECGETFIPDEKVLHYDPDSKPSEARLQAAIKCPHCDTLYPGEQCHALEGRHYPHERDEDGAFRPVETVPRNAIRSFWTPGLVSPYRHPGQVAQKLQLAKQLDEESRQGVVNTQLGQVYHVEGEAPTWHQVMTCKLPYAPRTIPKGAQLLTAGIDVSGDRLWYTIYAFGYGGECWLVQYGMTWGETEFDGVWMAQIAHLEKPIEGNQVQATFADSGYKPGTKQHRQNIVYNVARRHANIYAAKGLKQATKPLSVNLVDVRGRKALKTGVELQLVDTNHFKQWIHDRIRMPLDASHRFHVHQDTDEEYCRQMSSEQFVPDRQSFKWVKTYANHWFDCTVLAVAAAVKLGLHNLKPLQLASQAPTRRFTPAK